MRNERRINIRLPYVTQDLIKVTVLGYRRSWWCDSIRIGKASLTGEIEVVVDMYGEEYPGTIDRENFTRLLAYGRGTGSHVWMPGAEADYMIHVIEETRREEQQRQKAAEDFWEDFEALKKND